jgi:hypothetical protein
MKKLIAMLFALALVSSSVAFAECKPAGDKKMDKMEDKKEAKAKKHHKHKKEKAEKMEDKKDKM